LPEQLSLTRVWQRPLIIAPRSMPGAAKESSMGLFTKDIKSMDDLFLHVLQDIYYAEKQIVKALPDMIEKATNPD
jgi:hypothetical protein